MVLFQFYFFLPPIFRQWKKRDCITDRVNTNIIILRSDRTAFVSEKKKYFNLRILFNLFIFTEISGRASDDRKIKYKPVVTGNRDEIRKISFKITKNPILFYTRNICILIDIKIKRMPGKKKNYSNKMLKSTFYKTFNY